MIFSKHMYWGEHAAAHKAYILNNLREKKFQAAAYVITPAKDGNLYEIYASAMLLTPGFDSSDMEIVGIGYGYQDTLRLVQRMVEELVAKGSV